MSSQKQRDYILTVKLGWLRLNTAQAVELLNRNCTVLAADALDASWLHYLVAADSKRKTASRLADAYEAATERCRCQEAALAVCMG